MSATASASRADLQVLRRPTHHRRRWLVAMVGLVALLAVVSIVVGARGVAPSDVLAGLRGDIDTVGRAAVAVRVPRTVMGIVVGGALGVSGAVMQGVTRNPLAGPGILGINTGASLAVVVGLVFFGLSTASGMAWAAIGGAAVSAVGVYAIASFGRDRATPLKLALAGAAMTAALSSCITAVALPRADLVDLIRSWQIGGVGGATFDSLRQVAPFLVVGAVLSLVSARSLDSLALGDELATGLGERVVVVRVLAALGSVLLCGGATAVAGPIGFVGLVVPHACRMLVGVEHRWLLPYSAVTGAALLVAADVLGRVVARPGELDVGIVTALLGAPWFIVIVRRQKLRST